MSANLAVSVPPLAEYNTTEVSRVGHRLALGVQWLDALTGLPVEPLGGQALVSELQAIGTRPWVQRFERHTQSRQALRWAGRYQKLVAHAHGLGEPLGHELLTYGARDPLLASYQTSNDARRYVPRRLSYTPVLVGGVPPATAANTRTAWLWPGAAYPLPSGATGVRGCVRRNLGGGLSAPVPWARVVCMRPGAVQADIDTNAPLAWAHGDDRGEFVMLLGNSAVPGGGQLPAQVDVQLWVCLPPPAVVFDAAAPLASLPLDDAGTDVLNRVSMGLAVPPGYLVQAPRNFALDLGRVRSLGQLDLVF
jgi:hypothetical protein